ncbi:2Fe-2S iron-sulfur cluster-binding protein [Acidocella sp.]|jgi:2Fe-2S ferredoxin|uniref:2Fe-2S iron-sulfur cluster-binding protein n=1 Tax=Acidocella sp. TaxID=50710 RepID=UPI002F4159BB
MPTLFITAPDGVEHRIDGADNDDLMHIARDAGLPLWGQCNGSLACGTCHVIVDLAWAERLPPPSEDELDLLDSLRTVTDESRLSCRIRITEALDGLRVTIAEPD